MDALTGLQRHAGIHRYYGFPHVGGSFGGNGVHVPRQELAGDNVPPEGATLQNGDPERIPKAFRRHHFVQKLKKLRKLKTKVFSVCQEVYEASKHTSLTSLTSSTSPFGLI